MKNDKRRWSAKKLATGSARLYGTANRAGMMSLHLLSGMLVGGFIGYWLDEWLGTGVWLKVIFFLLGVAAGFRNMYLDAMLLLKSQEDKGAGSVEKPDEKS